MCFCWLDTFRVNHSGEILVNKVSLGQWSFTTLVTFLKQISPRSISDWEAIWRVELQFCLLLWLLRVLSAAISLNCTSLGPRGAVFNSFYPKFKSLQLPGSTVYLVTSEHCNYVANSLQKQWLQLADILSFCYQDMQTAIRVSVSFQLLLARATFRTEPNFPSVKNNGKYEDNYHPREDH